MTSRPKTWADKLVEVAGQMRLANDASMMEKDLRQRQLVERLVKKTQDGTIGTPTSELVDGELGEMAVSVGNEVHNYPAPKSGGLAKTIAAVGLAAAGLGTGAAVPIAAMQWMKNDSPQTTIKAIGDGDTRYGLRIFKDD